MEKANPSTDPLIITEDNRIPMSLPQLMLEVPEITGYVMHWFADRPGRISRALQAGYEFVDPDEVRINNFGVAADLSQGGSSDLGTRISVHGGVAENGSSERLYLMKIKKEWYDKDMALREEASDRTVSSLKQGTLGADREIMANASKRYAKNTDNLFTKNKRRTVNG